MISSRPISLFPLRADDVLEGATGLVALTTILLLGVVVALLIGETMSLLSLAGVQRFFTDDAWLPSESQFCITSMLAATGLTTLGAILVPRLNEFARLSEAANLVAQGQEVVREARGVG